ncbi:MAG: dimethylsulfonioproprionate lyase family protein [Pseudomonadota bacterium]
MTALAQNGGGSLERLHALAAAQLDRPACRCFARTLRGRRRPVLGGPRLRQQDAPGIPALLDRTRSGATPETSALVEAALAARAELPWWNAYASGDPVGRGFAERSAACQLTGPGAPFSAAHGRAGFFYVGADVEYAAHAHRPREIYVLLAGRARFWGPEAGWREAAAGAVVETPPDTWHAMETPWEPVLILWCWIGAGFDQTPRLLRTDGRLPGRENT